MGVDADPEATGEGERSTRREAHHMVGLGRDHSHVASCSCGWSSGPAPSAQMATVLHRQHGRRSRASEAAERARLALDRAHDLQAASGRRLADVWGRQAISQERRDAIRERRVELRLDAMRRLGWRGEPEQRWAGETLEAARVLSGLGLDELWVAYFAYGGSLGKEQLGDILRGSKPIGRFDHDVVVLTLNEAFEEAGLGRPVDFWDDC